MACPAQGQHALDRLAMPATTSPVLLTVLPELQIMRLHIAAHGPDLQQGREAHKAMAGSVI